MQKIFRKCLFGYKTRFAVEKKTKKILRQFQFIWKIFCIAIKKCQSYNFHIWDMYDKHFFSKNENLSFYHQHVLLESNSSRN